MPAENTWIEWRGGDAGSSKSGRHGILLIGAPDNSGRKSIWIGDGIYVFDENFDGKGRRPLGIPIYFDFPGGKMFGFKVMSGLEVFEDGEWLEWENEDGDSINDIIREDRLTSAT